MRGIGQLGKRLMQLEDLLANVLREPIEKITDETSPRNTSNWDSLKHIELVMAVEATYSVQFSMPEIASLNSLGNIRQLLQQKGVSA